MVTVSLFLSNLSLCLSLPVCNKTLGPAVALIELAVPFPSASPHAPWLTGLGLGWMCGAGSVQFKSFPMKQLALPALRMEMAPAQICDANTTHSFSPLYHIFKKNKSSCQPAHLLNQKLSSSNYCFTVYVLHKACHSSRRKPRYLQNQVSHRGLPSCEREGGKETKRSRGRARDALDFNGSWSPSVVMSLKCTRQGLTKSPMPCERPRRGQGELKKMQEKRLRGENVEKTPKEMWLRQSEGESRIGYSSAFFLSRELQKLGIQLELVGNDMLMVLVSYLCPSPSSSPSNVTPKLLHLASTLLNEKT
ncbi:unnamed protein product [Pleuronectes platessa]|uniref:Uncharacterized protein n=1 Tax=Pleuronectes platessa TaxID=8262 RepID=A0A9N7UIP9_PLEPL|nr:unnamed protein product [Pleuronectes platessa]